jgi:hypothetical protein
MPSFRSEPFSSSAGDLRDAMAVAERCGVIAQTAKLPTGTVWAEWRAGITHHFLATKLRHSSILSTAWRSRSSSIPSASIFTVNFFGLDQRIRVLVGLAAPCGCMVSLIARSDSCKRLSMKSGEPGSPGSDLRFAGLCLDVATVEW